MPSQQCMLLKGCKAFWALLLPSPLLLFGGSPAWLQAGQVMQAAAAWH